MSAAFSLLVVGFVVEGRTARASQAYALDRAHVTIGRVGIGASHTVLTCEEAAALSAALTCAVKAARGES